MKASVSALWGPKALDDIVTLDLNFEVETEKGVLRHLAAHDITMHVLLNCAFQIKVLTGLADLHSEKIASESWG